MLDEASLQRLAEMGIDVYVPRAAATMPAGAAAARAPLCARGRVVLLARSDDARASTLLAQVARALAFARVECAVAQRADASALADARGIVVFGEDLAREAGSMLTSERQRTPGWVACGEAAIIADDARAKRALWSELRRLVREFR
jgi:hypothetical protein